MAKYFVRTLLFLFLIGNSKIEGQSLEKENRFILKGHIAGINNKFIFLGYRNSDGKFSRDSSLVLNNKFQFKGFISEPTKAMLTSSNASTFNWNDTNYIHIYIEPTKMQVDAELNKLKSVKLSGSKTQNEFLQFKKLNAKISKITNPLINEYYRLNDIYILKKKGGADEDTLSAISNTMSSLLIKKEPYDVMALAIAKEFYNKYPNSFITVYYLKSSVNNFSYSELSNYYNKMSLRVKESQIGIDLKNAIAKKVRAIPGMKAPLFATIELSGDSLRLSDFRGKYVLLDFWATFCKPCRAGNPELIKLYNSYKEYGLEIIGIADDDSRVKEWKAAIKKDGIGIWKHVLRGRSTKEEEKDNDLTNKYGVPTMPTKILIDKEGKIIGRYGESKEEEVSLQDKLKEILGKN